MSNLLVGRRFSLDRAGHRNSETEEAIHGERPRTTWGKPYQILDRADTHVIFEADNGRIAGVESATVKLLPVGFQPSDHPPYYRLGNEPCDKCDGTGRTGAASSENYGECPECYGAGER